MSSAGTSIWEPGPGRYADPYEATDSESSPEGPAQRKPRWRSLVSRPWYSLLDRWRRGDGDWRQAQQKIAPNGTRVSPPVSPLLAHSPAGSAHTDLLEGSLLAISPADYYAEKLQVYQRKYSYMKSWPGLLRLLAGVQLLFGGLVFACVCAYIQKDSEWSNLYGYSGYGAYGSYRGPMTVFVLAVAAVAWLVTVALLLLGLTMYYRTILLDAPWWPLTEAAVNTALFLFYMAAGIVYHRDLNRGGLCYTALGVNPLLSSLCRTDGGQMAAIAFIFINMLTYLFSFLVCLKMWRHESRRRHREAVEEVNPAELGQPCVPQPPGSEEKELWERPNKHIHFAKDSKERLTLSRAIPTGHVPKPRTVADYVMKYPPIHCVEEREQYRAVFNDQYQEYKELHRDIRATDSKFSQLDLVMGRLVRDFHSFEEQERINRLLKQYKTKKNDPAFLEKQERCDYLKAKLTHIKCCIQDYDRSCSSDKSHR